MNAAEALKVWQNGGFTLSTWHYGDEVSAYREDIHACGKALAGKPYGDRYLILSTATARVEIYIHDKETVKDALEQCAAELAVDEVAFDTPEEEALARKAIPLLLASLEGEGV